MEDQDVDDLDLLASLVNSDSEFLDEGSLLEAIPSDASLRSPTETQQTANEQNTRSGTTSNLTMEEMAAQMASMEEYIKKLEAEKAVLLSPTSKNNIQQSNSADKEQESKVRENKSSRQDMDQQMLFSKDCKRTAHAPTRCVSKTVSSDSSSRPYNSTNHKASEVSSSVKMKPGHGPETKTSRTAERMRTQDNNPSNGKLAKNAADETESRTRKTTDDNKFSQDRFSSLRIINPLISSVVMEKRMEGRRMVKISQISTKIKGNNDFDGDWVTIGVIVQKMPPKKSSNGQTYGIWKLSDLGPNTSNEIVALFLFGDVYKEHWKTTEGSVVAVLNASLLPAKEKNSKDLALTLDNAKKLMLMGISKDLGKCKGVKKSDNRPCTNFVNRQHGEFCEYHVQAAYRSMRAQRMECQTGYGPSAKAPLMKKFQKDLNASTFMYQGRTVNASNHNTDHKKKNVSLKSLNVGKRNGSTEAAVKGDSDHQNGPKSNPAVEPSDFLVQLLEMPTVGSRNLIRHLNQDEEQKKPEEERKPSMSASELLKAHEKEVKRTKSLSTGTPGAPMLGRGLAPGSDLFFDDSPRFRKRKLNDAERAKLKALSLVKQKGPIEKEDPNAVRKKLSPKAQEEIQKKAFEESSKENNDGNTDQDSRKKRRRILGPEFGSIDLASEEGKILLAAKSQHVGAVREAVAEREEKYFNELEKKERLEDKMKTITELKVKVVSCKQCDYVAESASELCHKEKHALKYCKALKKFFVCKGCKTRAVSYGSPIPKHPCKQCGASNYQKTSIYKETEGPKIAGETLLVRGEEVPKFLNSL
ncbi:protein MCM10 homolog [Stylophora pistillata]|uniref:protein MCM10 homolog n=1 Tax=Stylophora pistillata TaxID=50429 RepID=UPI000C03FD1F|nr:protein MCM10 homolog [Stylophora pistillata]